MICGCCLILILSLALIYFLKKRKAKQLELNKKQIKLDCSIQKLFKKHQEALYTEIFGCFEINLIKPLINNPNITDITSTLLEKCNIQNFTEKDKLYNNSAKILETFASLKEIVASYAEDLPKLMNEFLEYIKKYKTAFFNQLQESIETANSLKKALEIVVKMTNQRNLHNFTNQFQYASEMLIRNMITMNNICPVAEIKQENTEFNKDGISRSLGERRKFKRVL
ncbi:MAG: hypothetical protein ABIA63_01390 [bacterium]